MNEEQLLGTSTVVNPLGTDFTFRYNGQDLVLESNSISDWPTPVARHAARHLANHLLLHHKSVFTDQLVNGKPVGKGVPKSLRDACMLSLLNREDTIRADEILEEADRIIKSPPSTTELEAKVEEVKQAKPARKLSTEKPKGEKPKSPIQGEASSEAVGKPADVTKK